MIREEGSSYTRVYNYNCIATKKETTRRENLICLVEKNKKEVETAFWGFPPLYQLLPNI